MAIKNVFFSILWQKILQIFIYLFYNKLTLINLLNLNNNVYQIVIVINQVPVIGLQCF